MQKYKFEQIAINSTAKKKPEETDKECYIGLEHLDTDCLTVNRWGSELAPKGDKLLMKKGDVLFGKRRAYQKKVAIAPFDGIFSAHGMVLRPNEDVVDEKFFPFFIGSDYFLEVAIKISVGSLSPTVNWRDLKVQEFNLPSMERQREVADILWAMNDTLESYKVLLAKTDEMVKSQFIEMFGDPYTNPKGWETGTLEDVMVGKASNGFFAKPADYSPNGNAGIICVGDVVNRKYSNVSGLRRANADDKQFQKFKVQYGDMLFCRSSLVKEGIAKASIVPANCDEDILFECHVIRVKLDIDRVIPEFMQAFTVTSYFRTQMMDKSKTATMTTIGQKDVISGRIYIPDIDLQKQFVAIAEQSDKSKFALQQSIDSLQKLMKATINQEFMG